MGIELRRRLRIVDTDLKIIPGRRRRVNHKASQEDWDRCGGTLCPECGQETVRVKAISSTRRVCPDCFARNEQKRAKREASLSALINSKDRGLARRARKFLDRLNSKGG